MMSAFLPVREFFGTILVAGSRQWVARCRPAPYATLTSRERRRKADAARINTHREIKREIDEKGHRFLSAFVSIPSFVRERCQLTHRTSRVKVFLERDDLGDITSFRNQVRYWLLRLFPEFEQRGLLRASDDFDMNVGGTGLVQDSDGLKRGIARCEKAGSAVYVEVIPHNVPPALEPPSKRVEQVAEKARKSEQDPDQRLLMVSFFKFVDIQRPDIVSDRLQKIWRRMGVKGRVYVAQEGVNAQLAIPEAVFEDFRAAMNGSWLERGESYVPSEVTGAFLNIDRYVPQVDQPFKALHVRLREKILADGFDKPLDWHRSGEEVSPTVWHKTLTEDSQDVLLLDCRNDYESKVGRFEGAEPLNTRTFKETWGELERRLEHVDRRKRIFTYCTGGIRCVKVNAFLEQKMGFTNTGRLQGGIVSYAKELRESGKLHDSAFKGVNHVFDGRMGEVITEDLLDQCISCGQPCNAQTDCANASCPRPFDDRIFSQCEECTSRLRGACSDHCYKAMQTNGLVPNVLHHSASDSHTHESRHVQKSDNRKYSEMFSFDEDRLLRALRERTEKEFPTRFSIMSSHTQASLLRMLISIGKYQRILEIGTFTGYATLAMARALPSNGLIITCEIDQRAAAIAKEFIGLDSAHGDKVHLMLGRASEFIQSYIAQKEPKFDMIFVDADKGGYERYAKSILDGELLSPGGIIVFDNVLFRGEVANLWNKEIDSYDQMPSLPERPARNVKEMQKTAKKLHDFNVYLKGESRLRQLILPFRDGLTIAQRTNPAAVGTKGSDTVARQDSEGKV